MAIDQFKTVDIVITNINEDYIPQQSAVQGERSGRSLTLQITNGGKVENQVGVSVNLGWSHDTARNADGEKLQGLDAFQVIDRTKGLFRFDYPSNMMQPGQITAVIQIISSNADTRSKPFKIKIDKAPFSDEAAESDNSFTALQQALSNATNFNGGPVDTLKSEAELNSKYPNGANGPVVVLESDGKTGYMYMFTDGKWQKGALYQAMGVGKDTVDETSAKRNIIKFSVVIASKLPNYDTKNKTLQFFSETGGTQDAIYWGTTSYLIPSNTTVVNSYATTTSRLVFNTNLKEFKFVSWNYNLSPTEFEMGSVRLNGKIISFEFPYTIDGEIPNKTMSLVNFLKGGSNNAAVIEIDEVQRKFIIRKDGYPNVVLLDNEVYSDVLIDGIELPIPTLAENNGVSGMYVLFDKQTKSITLERITNNTTLSQMGYIGSIRLHGNRIVFTSHIPFTINGRPFGFIEDYGIKRDDYYKIVFHRGFNKKSPENTIYAYKQAKKVGGIYVEGDVSYTKDGIPVIIHDDEINRTARNSDGTELSTIVKTNDITLEEILQYDFGIAWGSQYKGMKIPTLDEFIKWCKILNLRPYIELKQTLDRTRIESVLSVVNKYSYMDECTFIGSYYNLNLFKNFAPKARLGYVVSTLGETELGYAKALRTGENQVFINQQKERVTDESAKKILENGFDFECWTIDDNTNDIVNRLLKLGCTGFSTNNFNINGAILDVIE